ncbi:MAG TPA: lipocalin-like domain-containing protein [Candidatus Eisenbacteria bacterium]
MREPRRRPRAAAPLAAALVVALAALASTAPNGAPAAAPFDPMNARDATRFPRAHGAHPGAALEWWYVTGIASDPDGRRMGFEVTFFRAAVAPRVKGASAWRPGDLYFAHFALTDLTARYFRYDERIGRESVALAGADSTDLDVRIRDWSLRRESDGSLELRAAGSPGTLSLRLEPARPIPVAWGPEYRSDKSADGRTFSRYQSYPRLRASGTFAAPGDSARPLVGSAWFDHEWSDGGADPAMAGWDWFGLRLAGGRSVMIYRLRDRSGETTHLFGGIVERDGRVRRLLPEQVTLTPLRRWSSPRSGARYPIGWRVTLSPPDAPEIRLTLEAALEDQELVTARSTRVTYWEGVVEGEAIEAGAVEGVEGYLELTGYAGGGWPGAGARPAR